VKESIPWACEIEKTDNGYVVSYKVDMDGEYYKTEKQVFEEESEGFEKTAMTKLLFWIADYFGFHYNKFEAENLDIKWDKKGHKID